MNPQTLNQQAEQLLSNGNFKDALSAFQQVFLSHGKSEDSATQVEVARALRGAIYCLQRQGQTEKAAQILATLERRFGQSSETRVRRYLELARSGDADFAAEAPSGEQELDSFQEADFDFEEIESQLAQAHNAPATNAAPEPATPARASKLMPEEHVSLAKIEQMLENAFFDCELLPDDSIRVQADNLKIFVTINGANHLLRFTTFYGLRKYVDMGEKLAFANKLNDDYILIRASVSDDTTLEIDAHLPFNGGVLPLHIVTLLRLMARVIPSALTNCDAGDILT